MWAPAQANQKQPTFNLVLGSWQSAPTERGTVFVENWQAGPDRNPVGFGCRIRPNGDTTITERFSIEMVDAGWAYVALPTEGVRTEFLYNASASSKGHWVFENATNDYPKRIIYHFKGSKELVATIDEGGEKPKQVKTYTYVRAR